MNGVLFQGDQVVKSCYQERCDLHVVAMATSVLNFFHCKSTHDVMKLHDYM